MRKLLFLAYHYPPVGGGGVQRNRRFAQHLRTFGYDPVVVTGTGSRDARWSPLDATIADTALAGIATHRVEGPEPGGDTGLPRLVNGVLDRHDSHLRWWLAGALRVGTEVGRDCDAILASLVPYQTAETAIALSERLGVPWIADLQDPWALDEMWLYPTGLHHAIDKRRMRRQLGRAAAIVMNTPEAAARLTREFPELGARIVVSITNGFDAADFDGPVAAPRPAGDETFRIVHTGTMHTTTGLRLRQRKRWRRWLGGVTRDVDFLPRSHVYLLEALDRLAADDPELVRGVEVHLAGVLTDADREIAERSPYARLLGYKSHEETLSLVRTADLLFLPMHDLAPGHRAGLVPGKAYEYIASGRPILAAVPEGDVREILGAVGTADFCGPKDVEAMMASLRAAIQHARSGAALPEADAAAIAPYERRELTRRLAGTIDQVLGGAEVAAAAAA